MNKNLPEIILRIVSQIRASGITDQRNLIFEAIEQGSTNIDYLFELSISCIQNNRLDDAETILDCLSLKTSDSIKILYNLGLVRSINGRHKEAIEAYDFLLKLHPDDAETLVNKSSAYNDLKEYDHALKIADEAIKINPKIAEAWVNRGTALSNLHSFEESIKAYKEACRLDLLCFDAWLSLSLPLNKLGRHDEALATCNESIRLQANSDKAYANKAITLNELNRYDEAIKYFDWAINLNPKLAEYYFGKGVALSRLDRNSEALNEYNNAIALKPNYADAIHHKGLTLHDKKQYKEALLLFSDAIEIDPKKNDYWFSKGAILKELCEPEQASACFKKAYSLNPEDRSSQWANAFTWIPHLLIGDEDLELLRNKFNMELKHMNESISDNELDHSYKVVGLYQPFYLAYQNFNNKNMLRNYGLICDRFMRYWQLKNGINPGLNSKSEKIKIGIVSSHIYDHSVWNAITKGLLLNVDLNQFEVHVFYLGTVFDDETKLAKGKSTSFFSNKPSLLTWAKLICDSNVDVLIYPEIGMHRLTTQLASLRLCGMQIAAWGHPETTGLPSIDYYLSAELFESDDADAYTEKVVKLPNLGSCYYKIPITHPKEELRDVDVPILLCPGTPFKYDPKNDWIFIEIVKRLGKCKLVFFDYQGDISKVLKNRLANKFNAANLQIDNFVVFSPWLDSKQFYALMHKSSVFLDTIGFSGFNTAIQAIDCALPIVTKQSEFMRGNLASGLLKRIGLSELIASSDAGYIDLVIRLVNDKKYHDEIVNRMLDKRDILYEDTSVVRALESFLTKQLRSH